MPPRERSEPLAWDQLLAIHGGWLRSVVSARVGESWAVEEVLQEIALAAVAARQPPEGARVGPWLYRVAVRQCLLYRRRAGRQRKLLERVAIPASQARQATEESLDPWQWLVREERRAQVRQAVQELPRRDREVLLLKYAHNWSYRQLSEHMGITESAVEARLFRARRRLRALLSDFEGPPASGE
ncbi:MAG: sigma-70 family RNA polymerase sigma factor [Planctomycetales bacterium]|nr:sigma-70 family RNA polymerase sigma factor [Planctomycetales bacterium]